MKIINLTAENIKRLTAVEIHPDGNLVQITGRNGQGKTSVLDAIWWALAGTTPIQDEPIHGDEEEGMIELDLGDYIVTRTFKRREKGNITTALAVRNQDGAKFDSGQTMLDGFLGSLTFDPLEFKRMKPREQYDALKRFVPGIDFDEIEESQKEDFEARTELNRRAKEQTAAAEVIILPDDTPSEIVDVQAIVQQINDAIEHNQEIHREFLDRKTRAEALELKREAITHLETERADFQRQADEAKERGQKWLTEATAERDAIVALPEIAVGIDAGPLQEQIAAAEGTNEQVRLKQRRREHEEAAEKAEADAQHLTDQMEFRTKQINKAIEAANMPVEGLGLSGGQITYSGLPFDQAADSEQLRVSCAIAMRDNHKLKVIRVRDGSLLDEESLAILEEMVTEAGYQCWIERVETSGEVGFVIEDGHLKGQKAKPAKKAAKKAKA